MTGFSLGSGAGELEARLLTARSRASKGPTDDALEAYQRVLELAPTSAEALRFVGMVHLNRGQVLEALARFREAVAAEPQAAEIWTDLGVALHALNELEQAREALGRAVDISPQSELSLLYLGIVEEKLGFELEALGRYANALRAAQRKGYWRDHGSTPEGLHPQVGHAMRFVQSFESRICAGILSRVRERCGGDAIRRLERCLGMLLRQLPIHYADERQRPKFLYFPDLPSRPMFERKQFPWIEGLEAQTPVIRGELEVVLDEGQPALEPFLRLSANAKPEEYLTSTTERPPAWDAYFFYRHGQRYEEEVRRCPRTASIIDSLPLVRISGVAPEILFSVLAPGTRIMPHHGVTNTRVVVHLPLIVPAHCELKVGGVSHSWKEGQCVVFDDTYEHEAHNFGSSRRVVLILDAWNPYLDEIEISAITEIVAAHEDIRKVLSA